MVSNRFVKLISFTLICLSAFSNASYAWSERTHLAIAKAAGYDKWYNAYSVDLFKHRLGKSEKYNHYFNDMTSQVTTTQVLVQSEPYGKVTGTSGRLYGAIIETARAYRNNNSNKYYNLARLSHYIGDLSNPEHNITYSKIFHDESDQMLEDDLADELFIVNSNKIISYMYPVNIRDNYWEEDLAKEIARIANLSRQLGQKYRAASKNMTKEEAFIQLGHSASLLKAVLSGAHQ